MVRRLSAIMFTDLVGSTHLAQTDEKTALQLIREQGELAQSILAAHQGRLVKSTGDGMLVEFGNALDAIECAVDFQRRAHERSAGGERLPLRVRIGVHVGDVESEGADILGDAVNVAARVEPLADPGGICLSGVVWEHVRHKVPYAFERLGPKSLRGVLEPVEVYRVVLPWTTVHAPRPRNGDRRLAVLPLANMSSDPENEYFADGMTEELITVLSQLPELQVIARTSVTLYKTSPKPVSQIGSELGVGTVLEGSVRKAGNQVRITVQLVDADSQGHLWASTYDRKLDDIFAVQSDVAKEIAEALKIRLGQPELRRLEERPTVHPDSYLAYLKGRALLSSGWSEEIIRGAKKQFDLAVSIDPKNARAFSGLADATTHLGWGDYIASRQEWLPASRAYAAHAVELDPDLAEGHCSLGMILWSHWDFKGAEKELKRAIALNPSYAFAHQEYGAVLLEEGRVEEALRELAIGDELDPQSRGSLGYYAMILCVLGKLDAAKPVIERIRTLAPNSSTYHHAQAWYFYAQSDFRSGLAEAERAIEVDPEPDQLPIAWFRALLGERETARQILEAERHRAGRPPANGHLVMIYAFMDDLDEAFRILFKAVEEVDIALQIIRVDSRLEPLRHDPRFLQVLKKINLA